MLYVSTHLRFFSPKLLKYISRQEKPWDLQVPKHRPGEQWKEHMVVEGIYGDDILPSYIKGPYNVDWEIFVAQILDAPVAPT